MGLFKDLSDDEVRTVMASFDFGACVVNTGLAEVMTGHMQPDQAREAQPKETQLT